MIITCLIISGDVQGVGLRYEVLNYAKKFHLMGWVKNENNGTVKCCLSNKETEVIHFSNWLKDNFQIDKIDFKKIESEEKFNDFQIKY
jgi:acylphosphatase